MSAVMVVDSQSSTEEQKPKGRKLTKAQLQAGVQVVKELQTVTRSLSRDNLDDPKLVEMMSQNIVANDRHTVSFVGYIRPVAGYEYTDWAPVVEQVVAAVIMQHKASLKRQAREAKRKTLLLAQAG